MNYRPVLDSCAATQLTLVHRYYTHKNKIFYNQEVFRLVLLFFAKAIEFLSKLSITLFRQYEYIAITVLIEVTFV